MKNFLCQLSFLIISLISFTSCTEEKAKEKPKPLNYIVIMDLSDRILQPGQLDKDMYLIEKYFEKFEENSRRNLVLNSKNRFSVKIIPQKNSPLKADYYEDKLQIHLDEISIKDKNQSLLSFSKSLSKILKSLKKDALFGNTSNTYFGVDIWAYLHDNGESLSKNEYQNTVLVLTDGYFDFESQAHVLKDKNQYTSTRFLKELTSKDWKQISETEKYGLVPITLKGNTKWILAGLSGKRADDILQTEKICYFWEKWLKQSGIRSSHIILNTSKSDMNSKLLELIK